MKSYLVIGMGRFGAAVAQRLQELGCEVLIMDDISENIQHLADRVTHAVVGDARDEEVLRSLGVQNFDCAIVAIGGDLAASILITLNLKSLGVPQVICKAPNELYKRALEKVGADRVVIPEREMGVKLAQNLVSSNVLDYIELSRECGIAEIVTPAGWAGKSVRELNVRAKFGVNIIALRSENSDSIVVNLGPEYVLKQTDVMVVLGNSEDLLRVQKL